MFRWVSAFLLLLNSSLLFGAEPPLTLYVSTNGNDAWSGRLPAAARDGADGPKATLPAALEAARLARQNAEAAPGIQILIRGGRHELSEPIVITSADSGQDPERPLVIQAYKREKPVLSGERPLKNWTEVEGQPGVWETEAGGTFRSLWVDGERRVRARHPNAGYFRIDGPSPQDKPVRIPYREGDIRAGWAADGEVELIALLAWADLRMQIRAVDESKRVATLSGEPRPSNREERAQYYLENAPDILDAPGEWYLDRARGKVRYVALNREDPNQKEIIVPRLEELLRMEGRPGNGDRVSHVILRGLTFSHTDWELGANGYADTQAAVGIAGDLRLTGARDCLIEECRLTHLSGYALELGRGCQRIRVIGNTVFDIGAGGIRIGEQRVPEEETDQNHAHVVTDNHLYALGRVYPAGVGIILFQSGQNLVAHNHIHDLYYTAISVGWNWGYQETPCRENRIEFNHLHDIGQSVLSDMGGIYTLGIQKGTSIRNNLIHDVNAFNYGGWGLYTDEGSTDILLESNVVYRCKSAGFHQHYGRDNIVRNNIFALNVEHQLMRTREEDHLSFQFERNLVYFDSGALLGSNWSNDRFGMNRNLYFDTRLTSNPTALKFKEASLVEWRKRGHDVDSLLADPLFRAPARGDFSIRSGSPARKIGFQPIDLREVGVRKHYR